MRVEVGAARSPGGEAQCTYCRTPVGAAEPLALCPRCGVTLHEACRAEVQRCPTPGCEGLPPVPPRPRIRPPRPRDERTGGDPVALGLVIGLTLIGAAAGLREGRPVAAALVGLVLALLLAVARHRRLGG